MKKMQMRRRAILRHFASLIVCCATASAANLTLQLSNETAPPGGWAQIEVTLPAPALIGQGTLVVTLDPAVFGAVSAVATFSATGDAFGDATVSSGQVSASITSASASIGQLPGLPVLTFTIPVLSTAAIGTVSPVTATATNWTDAAGKAFTVTVGAGSVTIGGTLSVQNLSPGGGLMPAGTVVKINGTGFTASTVVTLAQVSIAKTQFVSAQEIDLTLASAAELTAKRLVLQNGDGEQAHFFSAMPSAPNRLPQGYSAGQHYMLPLETMTSATHEFNVTGGGAVILQNQNPVPATIYFQGELPNITVSPAMMIPPGELFVYSNTEIDAYASVIVTAQPPIRMLAPNYGNPGYFTPPISDWPLTPAQPYSQTITATPAAISITWQIGTAPPAPVVVAINEPEEVVGPFTLVASGAPFSVTPTQGNAPGNVTVSVNTAGLSVGTYNGSISVTPVGPNTAPTTIPMTLTVTSSPYIGASPSSLFGNFSATYPPQGTQAITVTSLGNPTTYTASSNVPWLTVTPSSGTTPGAISASFSIAGLAVGTYNGQIQITGPSNTAVVAVQMIVQSDLNVIAPETIAFGAQAGAAGPLTRSFAGAFCGNGCLGTALPTVSAAGGKWLGASVTGTSNQNAVVVVSADPTGLAAGTYTGTVTFSAPISTSVQWPVTLVVFDTMPPLTVTPPSLTFSGPADQLQPQVLTAQTGNVASLITWSEFSVGAGLNVSPAALYVLPQPSSWVSPAQLQVMAQQPPPGIYHGGVAISAAAQTPLGTSSMVQTVNVPVTIHVTPASGVPPYMGAIVNAASQASGAISPGEIITIFGYSVGPANTAGFAVDASGKVVTSLFGAQVLFDGAPAPLIYGSANQLNVMVPYEIANQASTVISLNYGGAVSTAWSVPVAASAPGIFTLAGDGVGPGAVLNQDGTVNSASNAAAQGSIVSVYATGEGQTSPAGVTGSVTGTSLKKPLLNVGVTIGGVPAVVQYAGSAPESIAGLLQVNAVVPQGIATGAVPVTISVGGLVSQAGVTMAVK